MVKFGVTGMSCAACSARVEKAVKSVAGVEECTVSLLTSSMTVTGDFSASDVISAVAAAGYGASVFDEKSGTKKAESYLKRLILSLVFLLILMYFSMGQTMFGLPLPAGIKNNFPLLGTVQLILTLIIAVINRRFFINGTKGIIHLAPNMDTLVSLGAAAALAYSCAVLVKIFTSPDTETAKALFGGLYFESAGMILTLITVGKTLEARSKSKTADALTDLLKLRPKTAVIKTDGVEKTVPAEELEPGDIIVLRSGDTVPADASVISGFADINEAALTGESLPSPKAAGDTVKEATLCVSGYIECRVDKAGADTTMAEIIRTVSAAASSKAPIARVADKVAAVFVPAVTLIAVITFGVWMLLGREVGFALARAISVLVISCPCSLGLATPVAIMVGSGMGAKNGVLFKDAETIETAGKIKTFAFDKTGTLTAGTFSVTDVVTAPGISENELLAVAASLEIKSEHPLSAAIVKAAEEKGIEPNETKDFSTLPGLGVTAVINGVEYFCGSSALAEKLAADETFSNTALSLSEEGKTVVFCGENKKALGVIALADTVRVDSAFAVSELKKMKIKTVMISGDNERTAKSVGKAVGIDTVFSSVMPHEKSDILKSLKQNGTVAMVGDGINDAPALATADVGIAIGGGTDIAVNTADIVLMKSSIADAVYSAALSKKVMQNIKENLFWAFVYNIIGIPVAAGVFIPFGITLDPMFAAAAMSLSSVCVVLNALRLNFFKKKGVAKMKKVYKVEGMMCTHCEAHVEKALSALPGVISVKADHTENTVTVEYAGELSAQTVKAVIEKEEYKFIGEA